MTAKGSEVKQAAKDMAKKVEDAFREEPCRKRLLQASLPVFRRIFLRQLS
jgi:hypothetical protein